MGGYLLRGITEFKSLVYNVFPIYRKQVTRLKLLMLEA